MNNPIRILIDSSKIPEIPVNKAASGLGLANMDQISLKSIVQLIGNDGFAFEQTTLDPTHLAAALLVDK